MFDEDGNLYGTTTGGGINFCEGSRCGVVFELMSSANWAESVIHNFDGSDGNGPSAGLTPDGLGGVYGTTIADGPGGGGTVFSFAPLNGGTFTFLYGLTAPPGTQGPTSRLVIDAHGNLYGTTFSSGAYFEGSVFKIAYGNGVWTYTPLHDFTGGIDGGNPSRGLAIGADGNLYGTAPTGGAYGFGVVFEITP